MDVATKYYAAFKTWEANFNPRELSALMIQFSDIPFYFMVAYLVMIFFGPAYMKDRKPFNLKPLFIIWNFILAVFSILGALVTVPYAYEILTTKSIRYALCQPSFEWWNTGATGAWLALFGLSKIPELVDTVFLIFQKKPVIFLHWYHHTTVMLYCWFAYVAFNTVGYWFGTMNFFVHSIMYSYYFMMSLSGFTRALVKPFNKLITILQILQMVLGLVLICVVEYYRQDDPSCVPTISVHRAALLMYGSYFVLFAKFFADNYIFKKRGVSPGKKTE